MRTAHQHTYVKLNAPVALPCPCCTLHRSLHYRQCRLDSPTVPLGACISWASQKSGERRCGNMRLLHPSRGAPALIYHRRRPPVRLIPPGRLLARRCEEGAKAVKGPVSLRRTARTERREGSVRGPLRGGSAGVPGPPRVGSGRPAARARLRKLPAVRPPPAPFPSPNLPAPHLPDSFCLCCPSHRAPEARAGPSERRPDHRSAGPSERRTLGAPNP